MMFLLLYINEILLEIGHEVSAYRRKGTSHLRAWRSWVIYKREHQ